MMSRFFRFLELRARETPTPQQRWPPLLVCRVLRKDRLPELISRGHRLPLPENSQMPERVTRCNRVRRRLRGSAFRQDPGEFLRKPAFRDRLLNEHVQEFLGLLLHSRKCRELGFERSLQ